MLRAMEVVIPELTKPLHTYPEVRILFGVRRRKMVPGNRLYTDFDEAQAAVMENASGVLTKAMALTGVYACPECGIRMVCPARHGAE